MSSLSHACGSGIWVTFLNASPVFLVFFFYVVCTHLSAFECLCHSRQMHQKSHACLRLLGVCPNEASKAALPPSLQHLFITVTRNIIAIYSDSASYGLSASVYSFCWGAVLWVFYSKTVPLQTFSSSSAHRLEARMRFWATSMAAYLSSRDRFNMLLNMDSIIQSSPNIFEAVGLIWFNSALSQCNTQQYNAMQFVSVYFKYGFVTIWRISQNKSIWNSGRIAEALLCERHTSEREAPDWLWFLQKLTLIRDINPVALIWSIQLL